MAGRFSSRLVLRASYSIAKQMITEPKSMICFHERHDFEVVAFSKDDFEELAVSDDGSEVGSVFEDFKYSV